jgi:short-subunit dehydrogenase
LRRYLIAGASGGLGRAFAEGLPEPGDEAWLTSRTRPAYLDRDDGVTRRWIGADLTQPAAVDGLCAELRGVVLDGLIYSPGMWEREEDLTRVGTAELGEVFALNVVSFIALARGLIQELAASGNGRVVGIGSMSGAENGALPRVGYSGSKFALRGAAHGLREQFRGVPVGFTVISPGALASDVPLDRGVEAALEQHDGARIPSGDLLRVVRMLFELSVASTIKEIHMPASLEEGV